MNTFARKAPPKRPQKGRPQLIQMAGTFLPSPLSDGHLDDWTPLSAAKRFDEQERAASQHVPADPGSVESLIRGVLRTANEPGRSLTPGQIARLRRLFDGVGGPPEAALLLAANAGDRQAATAYWARGEWVVMRSLMWPITPEWARPKLNLYAEIQIDCRAVDVHMVSAHFEEAADAIAADARLTPYFSQAVLAHLETSPSAAHAVLSQAFALCELQISAVARVACKTSFANGDDIAQLFDGPAGKAVAPGRQFVRWVMRQVGVATINEFVDRVGLHSPRDAPRISEASLKRWSAGTEFPSKLVMNALGDALFCRAPDGRKLEPLDGGIPEGFDRRQPLLWAARRVHKTQLLLELVNSRLDEQGLGDYMPSLLGSPTFSEWASARFEFWRTHWG